MFRRKIQPLLIAAATAACATACFIPIAPQQQPPPGSGTGYRAPASGARAANRGQPAPHSSSSAPTAAPSAPAAPSVVSVTLRNSCSNTVKIFFGDKPGFGSGTHSSLSGNSRTSKQLRPGDMVWLVDDSRNGISSTTVSASTRTIEVTSSCTGMTAR